MLLVRAPALETPSPNCSVPELTVVGPVYELVPVSVSAPLWSVTVPPAPEIAPSNVVIAGPEIVNWPPLPSST